MTTKTNFMGWMLAAAIASPNLASSQQPAQPAAPPQDTLFFVGNGAPLLPFGGRVDVLRGEGALIGGVVKGKPYTADSITETAQILADGNRITHRNEARIYRDSEGRSRREQTVNALGVWQTGNEPLTMVTINDPVADVSYFLDPVSHTARQFKPQRLALSEDVTWTRPLPPPGAPPPDGAAGTAVFTRSVIIDSRGAPGAQPPGTFEVAVPPPEGGGAIEGGVQIRGTASALAFPPTGGAFGVFGAAPGAETKDEDLGEQVLEGVLAHGRRQTQTIPAGAIGNERPIEIVAEQWYSAEIEAVVLRRTFDPRFGETTYRLVNLVRGEPSPELFAVPQDYEVPDPDEIEHTIEVAGPGQTVERRVFIVQPQPQNPGE